MILVLLANATGLAASAASLLGGRIASPQPQGGAYDVAWTRKLDAGGALHLLATAQTLVLSGGQSPVSARALDDGRELWSAPLPSDVPPAAHGTRLGVVSGGRLHVLDLQTGQSRWSVEVPADTTSLDAPDGVWVTAAAAELSAWDAEGQPAWHADVGQPVLSGILARPGLVIVATAAPAFVALDAQTGAVRWRSSLPVRPGALLSDGDRVYFGGEDGALYCYRLEGVARRVWRFRLVDAVGAPTVDDRFVYFTLIDNSLRAFDRKGGSQRWSRTLPSRAAAGPARTPSAIAVVLTTGELLSFPIPSRAGAPGPMATTPASDSGKVRVQGVAALADSGWIVTVSATEDGTRILSAARPHTSTAPR